MSSMDDLGLVRPGSGTVAAQSGRNLRVLTPLGVEAWAARRGATTATVIRSGFGAERSRRTARSLVAGLTPGAPVAVVGLCGALTADLHPGDVVVANALHTTDGATTLELPGADPVANALRAAGLHVRTGPIACSPSVVKGDRRAALAATGAVAVDMESAWLLDELAGRHPVAVVRVVIDTLDHELRSLRTARHARLALRHLAAAIPVLERWAAACGHHDVVLAGPRSFCAGVERAIDIVERALERYAAPVYVRRQIVHNSHVVRELEGKGAVFVTELDEVPVGATAVLAAHGVAPEVREEAAARELRVIDATCPLVGKVHAEAKRFAERDYDIVLIGHDDHEEVVGTVGEAPGRIRVVGSAAEVDALAVRNPARIAFLTQTTLAVDEVAGITARLRTRFPQITGPRTEDICYATQNRQEAVTAIAPECDLVIVVGSANSSNSRRLVEVAERAGTPAHLVDGAADLDLGWLAGVTTIGITAGASAPEAKVHEVVAAISSLGPVTTSERAVRDEHEHFPLPLEVR